MKVIILLEHRFHRTPDGRVWTQTNFAYSFWLRYLEVFDRVCVVARLREIETVAADWQLANGEMVEFLGVPNYLGAWQFLLKASQVRQAVQNSVGDKDAVILRVPSRLASELQPLLRRNNHPFAVEVVADPFDVFAPGSIEHPLRPLIRWCTTRDLRDDCVKAIAAMYVTKFTLQQRYTCPNFSRGVSDVVLPPESIVVAPRILRQNPSTLIFVGTMSQLYKAQDVLIKAVAVCIKAGLDLKLVMLGDGKYRAKLADLAVAEQIDDRVSFLGQIAAGSDVEYQLDQADLFVLPSLTEGLPRAMIEAMARGLPCLGSNVGGIPELLPPEDMVPPGDVDALAHKIREIVTNPERMTQMSARSLEKALEYQDSLLAPQRTEFYRHVRNQTETWLFNKQETINEIIS